METSETLTHKQLRHLVADRLRSDILEGKLKPGEWLRQERLASEYGVSQMPVREALKELASEGLVEHVPYRGARVVAFSADDVEDLYLSRWFLEGKAARYAALAITEKELVELRSIQRQMAQNLDPENISRYRELNRLFHLGVINACGRTYLIRTLNQMWDAFPSMLWSNFSLTATNPLPQRDATDMDEHIAIIEALEKHNPDEAERLVQLHIQQASEQLISKLRA